MERKVIHFDLDTFFVSVERILDPTLKGRPVIVGGNPSGRGVVAACSREARTFGVHSAMPIRQAHRLCPRAVYLYGPNVHFVHYGIYSGVVSDLARQLVPLAEKSSVDEFYLDLSQTESIKPNTYLWGQEIQHTITGETQLPVSLALASNKTVAKVATTQISKNNSDHHFEVPVGFERDFLSPFHVRALPGVGEVAEQKVDRLGIKTIGGLAKTDVNALQRLFGKTGRVYHERANGIDYSPVIETREQKSFSHQHTFEEDTTDVHQIDSLLLSLSSQLGANLREAKYFTGRLSLELCYSDFKVVSKSLNCSFTNSDQGIYQLVQKLYRQAWTRRVRNRRLRIEASKLIDDLDQQFLFSEDCEQRLYPIIDNLRHKYGKSIIRFAGAEAA
jgi:DNA polymerase-4